jgi:autotransporter-associated beta strand protein
LFTAQHLATVGSGAEIQYRYDTDNNTVILKNYPGLTEDLVSGGTNGEAATDNRIILQEAGNLYVGITGDASRFPGSGFESLAINGTEWFIASNVELVGVSATTFHVVSGSHTIGGPLVGKGSVSALNGSGPKATIDAGAALIIGTRGATGSLSVGGLVNNGSLIFARSGLTFDDTISGAGRVIQTYSTVTLTGTNSYSGGTYIQNGGVIATNGSALGTGKIDFLVPNCTLSLQLAAPADVVFNNELTGSGRINVNLGGGAQVFSLGAGIGDQFKGSLYLQQGVLDLGGHATASTLANSSLHVSAASASTAVAVIVGSGTKNIGSLTMGNAATPNLNAGALVFDIDISNPAAPAGDSRLRVGDFTLVRAPAATNTNASAAAVASGTIRLTGATGSPSAAVTPNPPASGLFEQDDANIIAKLVDASGLVSVNASNLKLVDANNAVITNAQTRDVAQGVNGTVATAIYDYRLTTGPGNDGLYVNYGLTRLDLLSGKMLDLRNRGDGGLAANTLGAKITGAGGLEINATGAILLNGGSSTYTGPTVVNSGKVVAGEDRVFGNTSSTHIKSGASVDMNGRRLEAGRYLVVEDGANLNLNGGFLRLSMTSASTDSSIAANGISGGGLFRIEMTSPTTANVIFEGDNPHFTGTMTVANQSTQGSTVILKTADAFGAGVINAGYGGPFVYENVSGTMRTSSLNNSGVVIMQSSTVFYTGTMRAHTRLINTDITFGPDAAMRGSGTISVDPNSTMRIGITGATAASSLTVTDPLVFDGGTLDFLPPTPTTQPRLTLNNISGHGVIWTNVNPNTGDSNVISFVQSSGTFELNVRCLEVARSGDQIIPVYATGAASAATINLANGQVESGAYVFRLVQGTGDSILMPDTGMWYLANDAGRVSRAAKAIVSTASVVGAEWHYSLDSVSKRMGDLRQEFRPSAKGAPTGGNLWARVGNQSISAKESLCGAAFDEDVWTFSAGVDKARRSSSATAGPTRPAPACMRSGWPTTAGLPVSPARRTG